MADTLMDPGEGAGSVRGGRCGFWGGVAQGGEGQDFIVDRQSVQMISEKNNINQT